MTQASYQVVFINPYTGRVEALFDSAAFYQLRYSRVMNGIGALAMTFPSNIIDGDLERLDMLIEVKRTSPITGQLVTEDTFLSRITHRYRSGVEERFTLGAFSLNHFLSRRIVDPADDPLEAGGYSTKAGPADVILYEWASQQLGPLASEPRRIAGLQVATVLGDAPNAGDRLRYENLLEVFQKLSKRADIQFVIERTTGANFSLRIGHLGVDRTQGANYPASPFVLLNPLRGNLSNPSLRIDRKDEANFVYLQGKGQGSNRTLLQYFSPAISDSPYNRIEFAQDARNIEKGDSLGLLTQADSALKERQALREFEFAPEGSEPGNIYRQNWDVGDKITGTWKGTSVDVRITEVEINIDGSGYETLSVQTEQI